VLAGNIRLVLLDKLGGAVITGRFDPGALAETLEGHFS
jgi:hypothetical protein